jgi:hypothetical protein
MTHVLDTLPLDFSDPQVQQLQQVLQATYPTTEDVKQLLKLSGISPIYVDLGLKVSLLWTEVLDVARKQDKLRVLLAAAVKDPNAAAIRPVLANLLAETPSDEAPGPTDPVPWKVDATPDGLERQIESQPSLLDISFFERGLELSASVVKLLVTLNDDQRYNGTGFRIGDDLLLTNHHVLFDDASPAKAVEAWVGYERSFSGADREHTVVPCRPETIVGNLEHDWAVVQVQTPLPDSALVVPLIGAAVPKPLDRVYIIQHPNGGPKKIGMIHNVVVEVTDDVVRYRTDTEGGSSGSPVFDEKWQVVGLHHRWETGTINGRPQVFNQGRRIERVVAGLQAEGLV